MHSYDGHIMKQLGLLECLVETEGTKGKFIAVELPVVDCQQQFGLLGRYLLGENMQYSSLGYKRFDYNE